ncbi:DUF1800 domain-containing protein [Hamadaea tsunoensis]|uniref:DUF1800 domain-containing protein n=1 Tax=Hamadaea tsunoensis TaxID=53368 RepID=UPI00040F2F94|nr:DUF1800 domain-containing protein [Hamadaea tsunoensis]
MADRAQAALLLRRMGFGPTSAEVDAAAATDPRQLVAGLISQGGPDPGATPLPTFADDPYLHPDQAAGKDREAKARARQAAQQQLTGLADAWVRRMATARGQFAEKMVFFWHGHWATSAQKVKSATLMRGQLETFRALGRGDFTAFARAMVRDPALIVWLDGQRNTAKAPNENLARELMELFTLGIGAYAESDVKSAAKALTGWTIDRTTGRAVFAPKRHATGDKTVLGTTADLDADGLVNLIAGRPEHAAFLAGRLWFRFASTDPLPDSTRTAMTGAYGPGHDVNAMLTALFTDARFVETRGHLVKQPVEWAVGAIRQLGVTAPPKGLLNGLRGMGQVPLRPPSVGGWPAGTAWLTTSSLQVRMKLAAAIAAAVPDPTLTALRGGGTTKLDALAHLLAVDGWTDRTRATLAEVAAKPAALITAALVSPEYTVS